MKFPRRRRLFVSIVIVVAVAAVSSVVPAEKRLIVATGPSGGVYQPLGAAVARVLASSIPDSAATSEASGGSADNIGRIVAGKADIGFTQADTAWDAYKGYGPFHASQPIRAIAVLYPNNLHVVVLQSSAITKISDLRDKRVSTGPAKSGTEIWAERLLLANGIDPAKDIRRSSLGPAESAAALKQGNLDAFIWSGGVPTRAVADLAGEAKIRLLDSAAAVISMLRKHGPVYTDGEIAANVYKGVTSRVKVAQVWNLLIVNESADEKLVYNMVKALYENKPELVAGHKEADNLNLHTQGRGDSPIKFHPGAKKYYLEHGVRIF